MFRSIWLWHVLIPVLISSPGWAAGPDAGPIGQRVQEFIDGYTSDYLDLVRLNSEAQWASNTLIIDGVDTLGRINNMAAEAMSKLTGSVAVIEKVRSFLEHEQELDPLQVKQLQAILYMAADNPRTIPDLVKQRIAAETAQTQLLYGYKFMLDGREVTPNGIDSILVESTDLSARRKAWETSKAVGVVLKDGIENLVGLRNRTVQALGYDNYFAYQVSEYGMSVAEMMALMKQLAAELRPLYRELHTWARYELAGRYGAAEVPDLIPADWLPNRWGQDWSDLVKVEGIDLDGVLADKPAKWQVEQAERFYVSLGFDPLPASFYELSSLFPVDPAAGYKKNTHASAWHMDLDKDVRCLMSLESNSRWYETTHHELGHIYYYMKYTDPKVPPLLRKGANRAFHEAVGSMLGLASTQKPFLAGLGLIAPDTQTDETKALLKEALNMVVFIPFSAGTMSHFEHDLYAADLKKEGYNDRWWMYVHKFQGIAAPEPVPANRCDACTKTHINDDAAQYYDYALSYIILHQLHAHIAKKILHQDPRATNYYGNKEVGRFLGDILRWGAVKDWRQLMRETLGEELTARPMLEYFEPLMAYLKTQNEGRRHTLPTL